MQAFPLERILFLGPLDCISVVSSRSAPLASDISSRGLRLAPSVPANNRLRLLARRTQGNAEAAVDAVDAVVARRVAPVAVRRPTKPEGKVPTAATKHAILAR